MTADFPNPEAPKNPLAFREDFVDGWGISKDFYFAIGILAAEWSRVEELLGVVVALVLELEAGKGHFVMANIGFASRLHLISALVEMLGRDAKPDEEVIHLRSELKALAKEVSEIYPLRNFYIHSFYVGGAGLETSNVFSVRAKGKFKITEKLVHHSQIFDVYLRAFDARKRLALLVTKLDQGRFYGSGSPPKGEQPAEMAAPSGDPK